MPFHGPNRRKWTIVQALVYWISRLRLGMTHTQALDRTSLDGAYLPPRSIDNEVYPPTFVYYNDRRVLSETLTGRQVADLFSMYLKEVADAETRLLTKIQEKGFETAAAMVYVHSKEGQLLARLRHLASAKDLVAIVAARKSGPLQGIEPSTERPTATVDRQPPSSATDDATANVISAKSSDLPLLTDAARSVPAVPPSSARSVPPAPVENSEKTVHSSSIAETVSNVAAEQVSTSQRPTPTLPAVRHGSGPEDSARVVDHQGNDMADPRPPDAPHLKDLGTTQLQHTDALASKPLMNHIPSELLPAGPQTMNLDRVQPRTPPPHRPVLRIFEAWNVLDMLNVLVLHKLKFSVAKIADLLNTRLADVQMANRDFFSKHPKLSWPARTIQYKNRISTTNPMSIHDLVRMMKFTTDNKTHAETLKQLYLEGRTEVAGSMVYCESMEIIRNYLSKLPATPAETTKNTSVKRPATTPAVSTQPQKKSLLSRMTLESVMAQAEAALQEHTVKSRPLDMRIIGKHRKSDPRAVDPLFKPGVSVTKPTLLKASEKRHTGNVRDSEQTSRKTVQPWAKVQIRQRTDKRTLPKTTNAHTSSANGSEAVKAEVSSPLRQHKRYGLEGSSSSSAFVDGTDQPLHPPKDHDPFPLGDKLFVPDFDNAGALPKGDYEYSDIDDEEGRKAIRVVEDSSEGEEDALWSVVEPEY